MQNEVMIAASSFARIHAMTASGVIPWRAGAGGGGGVVGVRFERVVFDFAPEVDRLSPVLRLFGLASIT